MEGTHEDIQAPDRGVQDQAKGVQGCTRGTKGATLNSMYVVIKWKMHHWLSLVTVNNHFLGRL